METKTEGKIKSTPNKKMILIIVAAIVLILIVVLISTTFKSKDKTQNPVNNETTTTEGTVTEGEEGVSSETATSTLVKDKFREEVPANIVVPDQNTVLTEEEKKVTAVPTVVTAAAPGVEAQFRSFDIKAEGGVFTPSRIIARVGDTVHINFTAVDKAYDIVFPSYNMKQTAKQGQTKILEFQAVSEGSFLYYCDSCGGEKSSTKGNIVIAK